MIFAAPGGVGAGAGGQLRARRGVERFLESAAVRHLLEVYHFLEVPHFLEVGGRLG